MSIQLLGRLQPEEGIGENELAFFGYVGKRTRDNATASDLADVARHASRPSHLGEILRVAAANGNLFMIGQVQRLAIDQAQGSAERREVERARAYLDLATTAFDEIDRINGTTSVQEPANQV